MSILSWFSRRPPPRAPTSIEPEPSPVITDAEREFVRTALDRFQAAKLTIKPELDRDLIVARALIDMVRWKDDETSSKPSLQQLFLALADETDSLTDSIDDVSEHYSPLSTMEDDEAEQMLAMHSMSIFVNARSITLINEDGSLRHTIEVFAELGDIGLEHIELKKLKNGSLKASFVVEGLGPCGFEIGSQKRPNLAPLLTELNRIAKAKGVGRYITVHEGSSESDTFILAEDANIPVLRELLNLRPDAAEA